MIRRTAFWSSVATLVAVHAVFPLLVLARARLRPRPYRSAPITPSVTVVVAAHDEAANIGQRVGNLLALDYPPERLEVIVGSDGSTDDTVAIAVAAAAGDPRVRVLDLARVGKAAALQAAVDASSGSILAFTDANSHWPAASLRALVAPFADSEVGGVAGDQRYRPPAGHEATEAADAGERTYWSFDRGLKAAEGRAGDVIAATGAIYAIRREHLGPIRPDVTDDFFISTGVIAAGQRLVFAPGAVAWEPVAVSANGEFGRKVRIMTRGLRGVLARRALLDPRRHGFYSFQLLAHKLMRRLAVYPLLVAGVSSLLLARSGPAYALAAAAQLLAWSSGLAGLALGARPVARHPLVATPAYVVLVSVASIVASVNVVLGRSVTRWEPRRAAPEHGTPGA